MIIPIVLAFIFGAIYGSFLNMLLWRLPRNESIGGHSRCPACHHVLAWYDLIPILSFLYLKGHCRYCHVKIESRYFFVELVSGSILAIFFATHGPSLELEALVATFGLLIMTGLLFFDLFYFILPDVFIWPAIVIYAVYDFVILKDPTLCLVALLYGSFFAILYIISRGKKIGFGDVKLAILLGLMFGYPLGFMTIVFGIWLAALAAIGLFVTQRASLKSRMPLGSFLALAAIATIIFQNEITPFTYFFK